MVTRTVSETRSGDVHALVLAAGAGTRMGGGKLRREWRGRRLLRWALDCALTAPVHRVWLVTGADDEIAGLAPDDDRLSLVSAAGWAAGLSVSLQTGIAALPASAQAALVFLGDMPRIPPGVAGSLIEAWRGEGCDAAAPMWDGQRGHPVLLDRALFPAVADLSGDRGAGALLAALGEGLVLVAAPDDGVLFDIDTPAGLDH